MISIQQSAFGDLMTLQEIGRTTFFETFAESNTEIDMQQYLTVNFSLDKLIIELSDDDSQFFIAWDGTSAVGYLKVNAGRHKLN